MIHNESNWDVDGCIFLYSVDNKNSFQMVSIFEKNLFNCILDQNIQETTL